MALLLPPEVLLPSVPPRPAARARRFFAGRGGERVRACLLALAAALLWCGLYDRLTPSHWRTPVEYSGDALEILAHIKAAAEWGVLPVFPDHIRRLGAPFGARWSEYPAADDVVLLGFGQLSRVIGLGAASNLVLMLAYVSAAAAFYFCARRLRCRWEWAAMGALLFAFSFQNLNRGLAHLSLVFTYTVPPALLSCWLVAASHRLRASRGSRLFCLGTAALIGIGNPYTIYLYLQLMGWAVVAQALRERRRENIKLGVAAMVTALSAFFLVNANVWLAASHEGAAPLLARNYGGVEKYALKPLELFLPPPSHRLADFAFWGHRYLRWSEWRGEGFFSYLGIVGAAGFLSLLITFVWRALRGRGKLPGAGLQALWILGFSSIGGINSILAFFFGLQIFRATNRYSTFLLGLGLFFVALRCTRLSRNWRRPVSVALAALIAGAGLFDQIPANRRIERLTAAGADFVADQALCARLESALPAGAMIFQLPYVEFPESRPVSRLSDYELFRPFLHSSTLRFTYGGLKGHARSRWYREYAALPVNCLVPKLEAAGFSALYINRRGYDDGAHALLAALAAAGRSCRMEGPRRQQIVVLLRPAGHPRLPLAAGLTFGGGWNPPEPGTPTPIHWAQGAATLAYFNPFPQPISATLALAAIGQGSRHLTVRVNGELLLTASIGSAPVALPSLRLSLQPGINRLDLDTDQSAVRVSEERSHLRAFALTSLHFSVSRAGEPEQNPGPECD